MKKHCAVLCICVLMWGLFACADTETEASDGIYLILGDSVTTTADLSEPIADTETVTETVTDTTAETAEQVLHILKVTESIAPTQTATLSAVGIPGTVYSITVHYSSGPSKAKALSEKTANGNGIVSWTWRIGNNTKPGTYRIVVAGGGEEAETQFTVTDKS